MKISFNFLMVDEINQEKIWYDFFNKSNLDYEIIIHSQNNPKLNYLNELTNNIYINKIYNKWCSLLSVSNFFIEESLKLNCDKTIFISNSCIPAKSIDYIFNYLNNNFHFIKYSIPCAGKKKMWDLRVDDPWPEHIQYIMANHQWCIIDKKHYNLFLNDIDRKFFENNVHCNEECYYSSILNKHGLLNNSEVKNELTTYVDWDRSPNGYNPYTFNYVNPYDSSLIEDLKNKNKNILFIRKISKNYTL